MCEGGWEEITMACSTFFGVVFGLEFYECEDAGVSGVLDFG